VTDVAARLGMALDADTLAAVTPFAFTPDAATTAIIDEALGRASAPLAMPVS
jgi:hypothetical protein